MNMDYLNYNKLNKILDEKIKNNATIRELDDFIAEISFNEVISNEEYSRLVDKAQDAYRI